MEKSERHENIKRVGAEMCVSSLSFVCECECVCVYTRTVLNVARKWNHFGPPASLDVSPPCMFALLSAIATSRFHSVAHVFAVTKSTLIRLVRWSRNRSWYCFTFFFLLLVFVGRGGEVSSSLRLLFPCVIFNPYSLLLRHVSGFLLAKSGRVLKVYTYLTKLLRFVRCDIFIFSAKRVIIA